MSRSRPGDLWVGAATAVAIVVGLWAVGSWIVGDSGQGDGGVSRIAVGRTDDGDAFRVLVNACGTGVRRVTLSDATAGVVWEVRGSSSQSETSFVIGLAAGSMTITQPLEDPLASSARYRLEVESNRIDVEEFTLRDVPPVGVLFNGAETTIDSFRGTTDRAFCQEGRLPFFGSLVAQMLVLVAGAALAVVAAGFLLGRSGDH